MAKVLSILSKSREKWGALAVKMDFKTYVILVNYRGSEDTLKCIESLLLMDYANFDIIVVDNYSNDDSVDRIRKESIAMDIPVTVVRRESPRTSRDGKLLAAQQRVIDETHNLSDSYSKVSVVIIASDENLGFAGGNNIGIRYGLAKGDAEYFWVLNNDTVVHCDALRELVETFSIVPDKNDSLAMCGSVILDYENRNRIQAYGGALVNRFLGITRNLKSGLNLDDTNVFKTNRAPDYISGCSLLVKAEYLAAIGLLNEYYFLYWEDSEWCFRCKKRGFRLAVAENSLVWHRKGSTTKRFPISGYYNARNSLLFMRDYFPAYLAFCLLFKPVIFSIIAIKNGDYPFFKESLRGYLTFWKKGFRQHRPGRYDGKWVA